jgi:fucose 4-O-acetylase-like acetyltransferase
MASVKKKKKKQGNAIKTIHGLLCVPYFITVFTKVCSFCFLCNTDTKINRSKSVWDVRFEVLTALLANIQVLWVVTQFRLVNSHRRYEEQ